MQEERKLEEVVEELLLDKYDVTLHKELKGKRVLVRADLNVPLDSNGDITDDSRCRAVLPSLRALSEKGAKVIIASHLGRPKPKEQSLADMKDEFSLKPVDTLLATLLAKELGPSVYVGMAEDCICLLENTRFHAGDTGNDEEFSKQLALLCDVFVQDAFGVVHRDQGSVTGVVNHVTECYPGPLVRNELFYLTKHLNEPKRPLGVIIGGAKVADKIGVISALIHKADTILVGGRMAFTFLAAQGVSVGKTQKCLETIEMAKEKGCNLKCLEMIEMAKEKGCNLLLPRDAAVADSIDAPDNDQKLQFVPLTPSCCSRKFGVDIGPDSAKDFCEAIEECATVFWNGPMGRFEVKEYADGTNAVAAALVKPNQAGRVTVVGGGDSVAAINQLGLADQVTHVSTGGGASLELIEGKGMPGLRVLLGKCGSMQV
eukprot:gene7412-541_t